MPLVHALQIASFKQFSDISKRYNATSIGQSAGGLPINHVTLSDNGKSKPRVGIICNVAGNSLSTVNFCLSLVDDALVQKNLNLLLSNYNIHVIPSLNIDGLRNAYNDLENGDKNANGVDLSHAFPYLRNNSNMDQTQNEPEVDSVIDFLKKEAFQVVVIIGASRTGLTFPLYHTLEKHEGIIDDSIHRETSKKAWDKNPGLATSGCSVGVGQGSKIISPDKKAPVGTLEDYVYLKYGSLTFHLDVSCSVESGSDEYTGNKEVLVELIRAADRGLHGQVVVPDGTGVVGATVSVVGPHGTKHTVYSGDGGFFWAPLAPQTYDLEISYGEGIHFFTIFTIVFSLVINIM